MIVESESQEKQTPHYLEEERKWLIVIANKYFALTQKDICERFNFYIGTVSKIITKYKSQRSLENNYHKSGRKTTESEYPYIIDNIQDIVEKNPTVSLQQIKYSLNKLNFEISQTTIFNILKQKLEYVYRKQVNQHKLTEINKQQRVDFCKKWVNKSFSGVWFSDESLFLYDKQDGFIWCQKGTNDHINYQKQYSYQNRQVHVWGAISLDGRSYLFIHSKNVDSTEYIKCLEESLLPASNFYHYRRKIQLQQDGARSHTSNQTKQFCEENKIEIIQNHAWSPDLSPIELIWGIMKKKGFLEKIKQEINTKEDISKIVTDIWNHIPQYQIVNCINHIKDVMKQVINSNGEYI